MPLSYLGEARREIDRLRTENAELLAALERVISDWENDFFSLTPPESRYSWCESIKIARALIAKHKTR